MRQLQRAVAGFEALAADLWPHGEFHKAIWHLAVGNWHTNGSRRRPNDDGAPNPEYLQVFD